MARNVILLLLAIGVGQFLRHNPLLWGQSVIGSDGDALPFRIYRSHAVLDAVLEYHKPEIDADDYDKYRNHCLRVLAFAGYYYEQEVAAAEGGADDNNKNHVDDHVLDVMALALAYHDIGLWTAGELAYLEPSVATLNQDWQKAKDDNDQDASLPSMLLRKGATFDEADLETARVIILQHHKVTAWNKASTSSLPINSAAVNAVRRGDWADATIGVVRSGLPATYLEKAYTQVPELGFHLMLAGMTGRLSPNSIMGQFQVLKILKW